MQSCKILFILSKNSRQTPEAGAVAAGILPAVEDGILPPGINRAKFF